MDVRQMNPEYRIVYDVMGCGLGDWWQLFRRKRFLCFTRWEYVTASSSRSEVVDALKKLIDLNWQGGNALAHSPAARAEAVHRNYPPK